MAVGAVSPGAVLQAYRIAQQAGDTVGDKAGGVTGAADFGQVLSGALQSAVDQGSAAEAQSKAAIAGHGNLLDVVTAVSRAELSLQTTVAVRDRVVQAYQDIMHMAI